MQVIGEVGRGEGANLGERDKGRQEAKGKTIKVHITRASKRRW